MEQNLRTQDMAKRFYKDVMYEAVIHPSYFSQKDGLYFYNEQEKNNVIGKNLSFGGLFRINPKDKNYKYLAVETRFASAYLDETINPDMPKELCKIRYRQIATPTKTGKGYETSEITEITTPKLFTAKCIRDVINTKEYKSDARTTLKVHCTKEENPDQFLENLLYTIRKSKNVEDKKQTTAMQKLSKLNFSNLMKKNDREM